MPHLHTSFLAAKVSWWEHKSGWRQTVSGRGLEFLFRRHYFGCGHGHRGFVRPR